MKSLPILLVIFLVMPFSHGARGQSATDYTNDVRSVDSIIAALYEVISGGENQPRDWARFRNLFTEDARLIPTSITSEGKTVYRSITPDQYVQMFEPRLTTGFFERELHRKVEAYGNIVHVFSTYETTQKKNGPVTMRGINSIQLLKGTDRYYVMTIFWSGETKDTPLPDQYLPVKKN